MKRFLIAAIAAALLALGLALPAAADPAASYGSLTVTREQVMSAAHLNEAKGSDIASATTTDLCTATGNYVTVTGTTTITGLGTCQAGTRRVVQFAGILTLTYDGTALILPTGANITTAAGDIAVFVSEGSGNWRAVSYQRANGQALAGALSTPVSVANGGTGNSSFSAHQALIATGSTTVAGKTVPDCTDTSGNHLNYTQSSDSFSCGTSVAASATYTVIDHSNPNVTVVNTSTMTDLYSVSIPANSLGTKGKLRITLMGKKLKNGGGSDASTARVTLGSETVDMLPVTVTADSSNADEIWKWQVDIFGIGTNQQYAVQTWTASTQDTNGTPNGAVNTYGNGFNGTTSGSLTLTLSYKWSVASTSHSLTCYYALVELFP